MKGSCTRRIMAFAQGLDREDPAGGHFGDRLENFTAKRKSSFPIISHQNSRQSSTSKIHAAVENCS